VAVSSSSARILGPVYLSTLGQATAFSLVLVALPFQFQHLGLSVFEYGVALAAYALGLLVTESLWGFVAFRTATPRMILGLAGVVAALFFAVGFSRTFPEFVLSLTAFAMLLVYPVPVVRWIALNAGGPGTGGSGTGRLGLFFGTGLVAGTTVGPFLFVEVGFLAIVLVGAALFLLSSWVLAALPWSTVSLPSERPKLRGQIREVFTSSFTAGVVLVALYFAAYSLVTSFLQYYSVDLFHGTAVDSGYVIGATRGVALAAGFLLGPVVDRWSAHRAVPSGFVLLIAGAVGTWLSVSYAEMVVFTLVFATGAGWLAASLLPLALTTVPRPAQGTAIGIFGSFEDLGLLAGPVAIGAAYATFGAQSIFPLTAAVSGGGLLLALLTRKISRVSEQNESPSRDGHR
jgi:predicted MFS family arabinose efflux permease